MRIIDPGAKCPVSAFLPSGGKKPIRGNAATFIDLVGRTSHKVRQRSTPDHVAVSLNQSIGRTHFARFLGIERRVGAAINNPGP